MLTINTLHTNPVQNPTTSRTLSRPPLPLIQNNPLSYNLSSTNFNYQSSSNATQNTNTIPPSSTQHHTYNNNVSQPQNTSLSQSTSNIPHTNTLNILPPSHNTNNAPSVPFSTLAPSTLYTPTYINASTSISEPIKSFDGLDHNYTPEEYLQHIEARVTFSLGLQPITAHEYKFWHARRMAFIQCSLTGTALSWYIRLNDTYKKDWHAFVQAFKKQFSSQKNAYYAQVEALSLIKKTTKQSVILHLKFNNWLKKAGVMKMLLP